MNTRLPKNSRTAEHCTNASHKSSLKIMASPAFKGRASNPYTWFLAEQLCRRGVQVVEFSRRELLIGPHVDIWHLHWPDGVLVSPMPVKVVVKMQILAALLCWARLRGTRIVWTVHNLGSHAHEKRHPWLENWFWRMFIPRVDAYISLTETGRQLAMDKFPALARTPGFVIPHGHYRDLYPDIVTRAGARARLGLPVDARVAVFVGQIRPYKNVPRLIDVFAQMGDSNAVLIVAGRVRTQKLHRAITLRVAADPRVRACLAQVPEEEMQLYLRSADLVVLPYDEVLNSGTALLALSFDRPVLVPAKGALLELAQSVGSEWVRLFHGELTPALLEDALLAAAALDDRRPDLAEYEWPRIADATAGAYAQILNGTNP
ncbi:MAG: glycosyltransferase family 4 protein [Nitrococcus mobilis]|nr:glycosyltransferase family 4 protein [Nitrococcus mobilis]